ncbi:GH1 family beta-glucosidase [Rhizobacter sp. OV335]|uniref:GH1 family beta-glucosidase n=1 Tax=Rhizobacter sp. OV335 TaxID=1500264 RepID=UPI000915422F|nr:GH1 family beta-glucosidase [Rhizobacter sp. OV335]SHM77936.1 beta-glucosidase [Rhizobacter sp. OV335]
MSKNSAKYSAEQLEIPKDSRLWSPDFLFGTATASYQIEGAIHEDGRIPSIWDTYSNTPGMVLNGDTGEFACDHYHRWPEDLEIIEELGVQAYRLSIAWPRVMDANNQPNPKGLAFYKRLLEALKAKGIQTYVTLYHWDLPQWIEDRGGWTNREVVYHFAEYAELVSREFKGLVTAWATLNEPWCSAFLGYAAGRHAPGRQNLRYATQAMHHLLLAHGTAVAILRRNDPGSQVGIVANVGAAVSETPSPQDQDAAYLFEVQHNNWVLDPLLKGSYPADLWRLWPGAEPLVLEGDLQTIAAPLDFLGINYYFRTQVKSDGRHGFIETEMPGVERTQMGWEVYPQGLARLLKGFHANYKNLPPIYITENGMASDDKVVDGRVTDPSRISFISRHLLAVDDAMRHGVDIRGYFIWSLLDNFEWAYGYERRFGIVHVDYDTQARTWKDSGRVVQAFMKARQSQV